MIRISNDPIILVDGSFYMHRAYYAFPPLRTSKGTPIWVVYGVINMIKSLLIRYQPIHIAVVFDTSGRTFRDDLFEKYKANRISMPKDLCVQIDSVYEILEAMGIPILNIPYVEADDVIATLAIFYEQLGKTVLISTGDKDMAQIVSSKIILINTISNIVFDPMEIEKKFGVPPVLIADYLALIGDRVDNIPGVPGIGEKTAKILLNKIGNLKKIYENLDDITMLAIRNARMIKNSLIFNKEIAWLSYKLATVRVDVPLNQSNYVISIPKVNVQSLLLLFKKYEFNSWLRELKLGVWLSKYKYFNSISINLLEDCAFLKKIKNLDQKYLKLDNVIDCVLYNIDVLCQWIKKINISDVLILNIYSDTFNIFTAKIASICISKCTEYIKDSVYIPINTDILDNNQECSFRLEEILLILKPILENPNIKKIGQYMKFYCSLLKRYNVYLSGMVFDVLLELYILYGVVNYQSIKNFLDLNIFNAILNFKNACDGYSNSCVISCDARNIKTESFYAVRLMYAMFGLHKILWSMIQIDNKLKKIFEDVEMPLIFILSRIESYGVLIDKNLLYSYEIELNSRLNELASEVYRLVNVSFNINSTKQLQHILYNQQKLPVFKKTPGGSPSTNEEVLRRLAKKYHIPKIVLEYRFLSKLKSTYINKLISMVNKESNRIHTSYNQIRTATGRLSSANPNLQNIPNRNYDGRKIRQAFVAPSGFLIVSADYSQIELRIMAHLSRDYKLINDFLSEKDIHATTAAEIFVTALHLVTAEQRHRAKTINFGLMYGMSAFGLSRQLSVTCSKAQEYLNRYFQRYPGIMQYIQHIKNIVYKCGYVSTLDGRKLYFPDIYSTNVLKKKSAERAAINAPMQGSAADIIKKAMVSIDFWLKTADVPVRMIMQVHDELVFEVQDNFIDLAVEQIKKLMEECYVLDVPLKVDIGVGKNWEQAH